MIKLYLYEILEYYDGILLFVGKDRFGSKYICSLYEDEEEAQEYYLSIRISDERLTELFDHKVDLRTVLLHPEIDHEYFKIDWDGPEYFKAERFPEGFSPSENMLPEEGYMCQSQSMVNELSGYMNEWKSPVFTIGANDSSGSHTISTSVASKLLKDFASLYGAVRGEYHTDLEVVSTQAASFNFVLSVKDEFLPLFDRISLETEASLNRIEYLFSLMEHGDLSGEEIKKRECKALVNIAKTYSENNLSLKFGFIVSSSDTFVKKSYINSTDISNFVSRIESSQEVDDFIVKEAIGTFEKCDNNTGDWIFVTNSNEKISGKSERSALSGIVISVEQYSIKYKVTNTTNTSTGQEKKMNLLIGHEPIKKESFPQSGSLL